MSVVNKMLNDLEKRQKAMGQSTDYVPPAKVDNTNKVVFGLVAMLVLLGGLLVWLSLREAAPLTNTKQTQAPEIVAVDVSTELDQSRRVTDGQTVLLNGQIRSSQLQASSSIPSGAIAAGDVEIVLDGESMQELVERLKAPVTQTQTLESSFNAAQAPREPLQSDIDASVESMVANSAVKPDTLKPTELTPETSSSMKVSSSRTNQSVSGLEQQANQAIQVGNKDAAISALQSLIDLEPNKVSARKKLASLLFAKGDFSRTFDLLSAGIAQSPNDASMRLMQARLLFRTQNQEQALTLLKAHPKTSLNDTDLLSFRAALAEKQQDYVLAMQDYQTLIAQQPNNARWWLGLGVSFDKQGLSEEARKAYQEVQTSAQLSEQVLAFIEKRLAVLGG